MRYYPIFAIISIILISGCIGQTGTVTTEGYGLEITEFTFDTEEIFSGRTLHPSITIENLGQDTVSEKRGLVLLIAPTDWIIKTAPTDSSGTGTERFAAGFKKDLDPANPTINKPASIKTYRWGIESPDVEAGQQRTDQLIAKIYYDYTTKAQGTIWVYPESERDEATIKAEDSFVTTRGPVDIDIAILPDPPVVESDNETFILEVLFTNIGEGSVYPEELVTETSYNIDPDMANTLNLSIDFGSAGYLFIDDEACHEDILLINNQATIICDIRVKDTPPTKRAYPITITARYGYTTEQERTVTIVGK